MKIWQTIKTLIQNKEKVKAIADTLIKILDALDGVKDWEKIKK